MCISCAIPQLLSAPLNPIPSVERQFRRSHPQCEHGYWQGIRVHMLWVKIKFRLKFFILG